MNLVFDISDIVIFVQHFRRVTGIQRVVLNLLAPISQQYDVVFCDPVSGGFYRVDPVVFSSGEFAADDLARTLRVRGRDISPAFKYADRPLKRAYHVARHRVRNLSRTVDLLDESLRWQPPSGPTRYVTLGAPYANARLEAELQTLMREHEIEPVVLIHDLRPIVAPELETVREHALKSWFERRASVYERFLVYSRFTEEALRTTLDAHDRRTEWIRDIPLPHEFLFHGEPVAVGGLVPGNFVLMVGSLAYPHKNFDAVVEAWRHIAGTLGAATPVLVCAGSHGKEKNRLIEAERAFPELAGKLLAVNEPADTELAWLYRNCRFTVFPSLYEGWGLPVGESAWMGKLCVASNRASIPEVLGPLADYFDPQEQESMRQSLLKPLMDDSYLHSRERALATAPLKSWREASEDLICALRD